MRHYANQLSRPVAFNQENALVGAICVIVKTDGYTLKCLSAVKTRNAVNFD